MGQASLNSQTVMYGVIGDPIGQSRSPIMLNRAFKESGINAAYTAFHVTPEKLRDAIEGIKALQFGGLNVTIPHKVEVMKYVDEVHESAKIIGAVNTLVNDDGRWIGYNTDGIGYVRSLKEETGLNIKGKKIVIIGAGGAARGIGYALAQEQPEAIYIANRTVEKAVELAQTLSAYGDITGMGIDDVYGITDQIDLVVNTTAVGMYPHVNAVPLDPTWLKAHMTVSDLIYNPLLTTFLTEAKRRGCQVHGGLGMFIYQGAYAFEYWTGKAAPVAAMRAVVEQSLGEQR